MKRVVVAIAIVAVGLGWMLYTSAVSAQEESHPLLGKAAPNFTLDLLDGGKMTLADHKDKNVVVIDFWATWCGPCRMSLPILVKLVDEFKDKGVVFYGVDLKESPEAVKAFQEKAGLKFPVALDKEAAVADQYKVSGIPQTVVISKDGTVKSVHIGFDPDMKASFKKELDALTSGKEAGKKAEEAKKPVKTEKK